MTGESRTSLISSCPGQTQAHEIVNPSWHSRYRNRYRYRLSRQRFSIAIAIPIAKDLVGLLFSEQRFIHVGRGFSPDMFRFRRVAAEAATHMRQGLFSEQSLFRLRFSRRRMKIYIAPCFPHPPTGNRKRETGNAIFEADSNTAADSSYAPA